MEQVRIEKYDGNLFIKTKGAILFIYHNSTDIEWLVDGEILAFSKTHALYKQKDGSMWMADWSLKG